MVRSVGDLSSAGGVGGAMRVGQTMNWKGEMEEGREEGGEGGARAMGQLVGTALT